MKYHRPNHRDEPIWITRGPDYAPKYTRNRLFDRLGNYLAAAFFFCGLVIFIGALHYLPDPSDLERRIEQRMEMMP